MSQHQRFHPLGTIPFSWENQPGVSKVIPETDNKPITAPKLKLRPPPCPSDSPRPSRPGIYVPLPPCPFQPAPMRYTELRREDDPFFIAYMKCTKSGKPEKERKRGGGSWKDGLGLGFMFSCKHACGGVRDDSMVSISHVPTKYLSRKRSFSVQELKKLEHLRPSSFHSLKL
ncbi:hypothetical protein J5N97_008611 [Dioscorea zingiberensis]|uniref:Uncharacterized protein n=1 Tax=Dioscorea zingiberensis TaxID=325984 RepID=A0A9D5HL67_9LILI|nr:hypothetical protein J5N97_008611 [Dioscorea zingiberensis]